MKGGNNKHIEQCGWVGVALVVQTAVSWLTDNWATQKTGESVPCH